MVVGLGDLGIFGEGARPHAEDHLVAGLPAFDLAADRMNRARAFHAGNERHLLLVLVGAGDREDVGKIDARRADPDDDVARPRLGCRDFLDLQDGRIAEAIG